MGIIGPPNINKLYISNNYVALIKALNNQDYQIAKDAEEALNKLVHDKNAAAKRKKIWTLNFHYNPIFKSIAKLDQPKQDRLQPLIQILKEEKALLKKNQEGDVDGLNDLKMQFEEHFGKGGTNLEFFKKLSAVLDKNEKFVHTTKNLGRHWISAFSGIIVTESQIVYFDLGVVNKIVNIKFKDVKSAQFGAFNRSYKVISNDNSMIKFALDFRDDDQIAAYIEERLSEITRKKREMPSQIEDSTKIYTVDVKANCSICDKLLEGRECDWVTYKKKIGKYAPLTLGMLCKSCGSVFCVRGHRKKLQYKFGSGYEKTMCPQCEAPLRSGAVILELPKDVSEPQP